jgi:hypothetical protein
MSAPAASSNLFRVVEPAQSSAQWDDTAYCHAEKLMKRAVQEGDCLEYKHERQIRFAGWSMLAQRVAWKLAHRETPAEELAQLCVTQTCGNKKCVNIKHLAAVRKRGVAATAAAAAAALPSFDSLPLAAQRDILETRDANAARQKSDDRILAMFARAEAFQKAQEIAAAAGPVPPTPEELARKAWLKERRAIQQKKTQDHIKLIVAEQRAKDAAKAAAARGPSGSSSSSSNS